MILPSILLEKKEISKLKIADCEREFVRLFPYFLILNSLMSDIKWADVVDLHPKKFSKLEITLLWQNLNLDDKSIFSILNVSRKVFSEKLIHKVFILL